LMKSNSTTSKRHAPDSKTHPTSLSTSSSTKPTQLYTKFNTSICLQNPFIAHTIVQSILIHWIPSIRDDSNRDTSENDHRPLSDWPSEIVLLIV